MDQDNAIENIFKTRPILKWTFIIGLTLIAGYGLKDKFAILFILTIIILNFTGRKNIAFFIFLIWIFTYKFYVGQGLTTSKYFIQMEKAGFLVFLISFLPGMRDFKNPFYGRVLKVHLAFLFIVIISYIINSFDITRTFIRFTCFFIFIIIIGSRFEKKDYYTICHIIIALAIIQNIVSLMQYTQMLEPPRTTFVSQVSETKWVAGLNDSQCGTFGAVASNYVSWFLSYMSIFCISYGLIKNNLKLQIFGIILLFQYSISESKTTLGTTILLFTYAIYRLVKLKDKFDINLGLLFKTLLIIFFTAQIFITAWNNYYVSLEKSNVPKPVKEVTRSLDLIKKDPLAWGKLSGYGMVAKLQKEEYPLKVLFGFGIGEYEWGNREYFVITRDVSAMSFNNFTNMRSSLIHYYAELGVFGMILLFMLYYFVWQYYKQTEFKTTFGKAMKIIYAPFILTSFMLGFLYSGIQFNNSYPIFTFWLFTALVVKFEAMENETKNV
jgi:hypothetical protein